MTAPILVAARDRQFDAAIAELAPFTAATSDSRDAVCVVSGRGLWWESAERSAAEGARVVLVTEPGAAPAVVWDRLAALPVPLIVSRRRLRADLVADAVPDAEPLFVAVDAFAPRGTARAVLRDAVGWARILSGSSLRAATVSATGQAVLAALQGEGAAASVTLSVGGAGTAPALQAVAIGARRVEVRVDEASGLREVSTTDEAGGLVRPPRRESAERVALRRALQAAETRGATDLADLRSDDELAAVLLSDPRS